ncbi:40S ribosomal protein S20-1-like [Panicum miliaceum]|uniref:40S ribosomal protein S20-1-like n=1 Tax=Panicum miliaceum TaxID=4540 RepID=A0A3L6SEF2_PANMI|nr:40S ribosomal protein S20-1-like [Panicum miliaceum]
MGSSGVPRYEGFGCKSSVSNPFLEKKLHPSGEERESRKARLRTLAAAAVYHAGGAMKGGKLGMEDARELQLNLIRITYPPRTLRTWRRLVYAVCADLVKGAMNKELRVKGPVRIPTKGAPHHHPQVSLRRSSPDYN